MGEPSIRQDVLHFVPQGPEPMRVLAIDECALLPRLLERLPEARVTAVTRFAGLALPAAVSARVPLLHADVRRDDLPLPAGSFDLILAPHVLTEALDPYACLLGLSHLLTDVGRLVTSFLNVRAIGVLRALQAGEFPFRDERLYAKAEVVRLLNDALFKEIDADGDTKAYIRTDGNGEVIGFIQFRPETFRSRFFEETCGFIREFWVDRECRRLGHGSELLLLTEAYFAKQGITTCVLTVGDGARFYERRGYKKSPSLKAKNDLDVYVKRLK